MSLRAILIRVGVDQTYGRWNAPCNPDTNDFVYVPIPQIDVPNASGLEKRYMESVVSALLKFSNDHNVSVTLPKHLQDKRMHLDPDFDYLSYGDTKQRGSRLIDFEENDVVMFYSSFRSIRVEKELIYGLMGMLVVKTIERVADIEPDRFDENAHTRNFNRNETDVVVRGKEGVSGRFNKYIPIGEFRSKSYRVRTDLLKAWGGLSVKDGWIQRSVNPPIFLRPEVFLPWLENNKPELRASNV